MRLRLRIAGVVCLCALLLGLGQTAEADPVNLDGDSASLEAEDDNSADDSNKGSDPAPGGSGRGAAGSAGRTAPALTPQQKLDMYQNRASVLCALTPSLCDSLRKQAYYDAVTMYGPGSPPGNAGAGAAAAAPRVTAAELAQRAIAQIQVKSGKIGAGPNTGANGLVIDTAVGYPVWLWVEDPPGTISDSASDGDLKVSLSASISSVKYDMGDGKTIVCHGLGTKWGSWVEAGTPSPDCGYTYHEMGRYTIKTTTTWAGEWSGPDDSGTFDLTSTSSRPYRVGEIQALIRSR